MTRVVLDTSAYAAFMRGLDAAVAPLRETDEILVPAVVLGEILAGFAVGSRADENRKGLDSFLESPRVRVVAIEEATAIRYAAIYASLRRSGHPIPTNDMWIAACAMQHGAELLTSDTHFRAVGQILVRLLPA